ncbi:MAG: hypothetical protein HYV95_03715 [Opitutae bacterium]|nr:hypothetical protein [Opitutae bacterium]
MPESYLEKCVRALPPEKQTTAREAFRAIAENGDDNLISKLLVTLEATSAYSATIPETLASSGERFLSELDLRLARTVQAQTEQETRREERLRQLLTELVPQLGKSLALDRVAAGLQAQTTELGRVERSLVRLRRARVGGLCLLMALGFLLGAGAVAAYGWREYRDARQAARFVDRLSDVGVVAKIQRSENGEHLSIEGPAALRGTAWRKDERGYINGADLVFPIRNER